MASTKGVGLRSTHQLGADRHGVFTERGQADLRSGRKRFHREPAEGALHRDAQRLADEGESAAQHDGLRMEKVNGMGKPEGEVLSSLVKNAPRRNVSACDSGPSVAEKKRGW